MSASLANYPVPEETRQLLETLGDDLLNIKAPSQGEVKPSFDATAAAKQPVKLDGQAAHAEAIKPKDVF